MKIGTEDIKSFMTLNYKFQGIRILDDALIPTSWTLRANLVAAGYGKDRETLDLVQESGSIAYQKAYFWIDLMLPGIILTNVRNKFGLTIATSSSNTMMYCPSDPTDDLIIQLIHAKLTAITNQSLHIGEITLEGTDSSASYTFSLPKTGYTLPETVKEYVDLPSLHRKPWWHRDDGFCFEFLKQRSNKEKIADIYGDVCDPLKEFEEALMVTSTGVGREPAEIIQVERWKPKKV